MAAANDYAQLPTPFNAALSIWNASQSILHKDIVAHLFPADWPTRDPQSKEIAAQWHRSENPNGVENPLSAELRTANAQDQQMLSRRLSEFVSRDKSNQINSRVFLPGLNSQRYTNNV